MLKTEPHSSCLLESTIRRQSQPKRKMMSLNLQSRLMTQLLPTLRRLLPLNQQRMSQLLQPRMNSLRMESQGFTLILFLLLMVQLPVTPKLLSEVVHSPSTSKNIQSLNASSATKLLQEPMCLVLLDSQRSTREKEATTLVPLFVFSAKIVLLWLVLRPPMSHSQFL